MHIKHSLSCVTLEVKSKEIMSQTNYFAHIYLKSLWENVDIIHEPHHLNLQAPRLKHVLLNGQEGGVRLLRSLKVNQQEKF